MLFRSNSEIRVPVFTTFFNKPINNAFLQSLLRAIGLVELEKPEQLTDLATRAKGVWSLPWPASTSKQSWLFAPLSVSEATLTSKAGRVGLHDALTVVLPRDKVMSPDAPAVGLVTGLGTWHSFHEKLPVDLVVEELNDRLRLGIGARFTVEEEGKTKPRLVALARLCEVAVGPTGATLARPCEPLELQATLTGAGPFRRVGLGATFSLTSKALDARLLVVDVDATGPRVALEVHRAGGPVVQAGAGHVDDGVHFEVEQFTDS